MKRSFVFLLVLLLLCTGFADNNFDTLFQKQSVVLYPVPYDVSGASTAMNLAEQAADGQNVRLIGISPDGSTYLFDTVAEGKLISVRNGTARLMQPNENRGVADEYGNLSFIADIGPANCIDNAGIIWSSDGRYFSMTALGMVLQMNLRVDPILFDTETGEFFLVATYSNSMFDSNASAISEAVFSINQDYFFFKPYLRMALCRYDLNHGIVEMLPETDVDRLVAWPSMYMTDDGRIICPYSASNGVLYSGLLVYTEQSEAWNVDKYTLPGAMVGDTATGFGLAGFFYVADTCIVLQRRSVDKTFFTYFSLSNYPDGIKSFSLDINENGVSVVDVDMNDINTEFWNSIAEKRYSRLSGCLLSPDGKYVLCSVAKGELNKTVIIELSTFRIIEVELPRELEGAVEFWDMQYRACNPSLQWLENGDILAYTPDGGTGLFKFIEK